MNLSGEQSAALPVASGANMAVFGGRQHAALLDSARHSLLRHEGFDLGRYKEDCVWRRLEAACGRNAGGSLEAYLKQANTDEAVRKQILAAFSVPHSEFFRNPDLFGFLGRKVLPLLAGKAPLHFVSAGCARGEEAYSLALLALIYLPEMAVEGRIRVTGIDMDAGAVSAAREGTYDRERLRNVDTVLVERYFEAAGENRVRAGALMRRMISCMQSDLFTESLPPAPADVLLVRNVMIYLTRQAQLALAGRFATWLRPGGVLVLGKTESLPQVFRQDFEVISLKDRVYRKKGEAGRVAA